MKKILGRFGNPNQHWVGDGFPVRSLFSYNNLGQAVSPFLLLDYAGPKNFDPAQHQRGVGQHPIAGSRRSPSSMTARSNIRTRLAMAASSVLATSSG